ncbi:MAG: heme exporter protein CcmB [Deltaproteobacteria bacterium]|nr:heme exporter protein CcmB [Deltaproteobacteria bacterium]MBN2673799.1 heme exporter protein CcmB [Deltaproteobacteria bacterium]
MNLWKSAWCIFQKDMLIERKSKQIVTSTFVFALLVVVLCAFAFDLNKADSVRTGAGALWIAICFSGVLAISRSYLKEREMGVWSGLLLSPASKTGFYLGKIMGLMTFLTIIGSLLIPIVELFFHTPLLENLNVVAPTLLLGILGFCAVGALFGAMIVRTSVRDLVLGVVLLPLVSPILILCAKATQAAVSSGTAGAAWEYLRLVVVIDVLFVAIGMWLFEPLMED